MRGRPAKDVDLGAVLGQGQGLVVVLEKDQSLALDALGKLGAGPHGGVLLLGGDLDLVTAQVGLDGVSHEGHGHVCGHHAGHGHHRQHARPNAHHAPPEGPAAHTLLTLLTSVPLARVLLGVPLAPEQTTTS